MNFLHEYDHRPYVIEFFVKFSRFEYALKVSNFFVAKEDGVIQKANIDKYISSMAGVITPGDIMVFNNYLKENPVKKLKIDMNFHRVPFGEGMSELAVLVENIKRIRNNLFHGNKFGEILPEGWDRSEKLILGAIKVVDWLASLNREVRYAYGL